MITVLIIFLISLSVMILINVIISIASILECDGFKSRQHFWLTLKEDLKWGFLYPTIIILTILGTIVIFVTAIRITYKKDIQFKCEYCGKVQECQNTK